MLFRSSRVVELADEMLGGSAGKRIAVLGAAFKPNSDDVRDSPALDIASTLQERGADVIIFDPEAMANALKRFPKLTTAQSIDEALTGADAVLHLTEWKVFREVDPAHARSLMRHAVMIDGRNALDLNAWRAAGFEAKALGRP